MHIYEPCNIHPTAKIGTNTKIGAFCDIGKNVVIGKNCNIQAHVTISNNCQIGNHVFIGPNTSLLNTQIPVGNYHNSPKSPVVIEDDVRIGGGCVILPSVTVKKGAFVGAGSVVTKNVEVNTLVVGNPARKLLK
jgi:acetyltransferase-like isoleucine patch superfamily enzyme